MSDTTAVSAGSQASAPDLLLATIGRWLGYALFFLMLFVPTTYQPVKGVLLAVLVLGVATDALARGRLRLHPVVGFWTLLLVTVGMGFMLLGLMRQAPGAIRVGTVYVLWPIAYTVLVSGLDDDRLLDGMLRVLVVSAIVIALYGFSYLLHVVGWLPAGWYLPVDQGQALGLHQGYVELNINSLASILFLVPFLIGALLAWPGEEALPVRRIWLWVAVTTGLLLVLLSGRRALLLVLALSPAVALAFRALLPPERRRSTRGTLLRGLIGGAVALVLLLAYLQIKYQIGFHSIWLMFAQGFAFTRDVSASLRRQQFFALLQNWAAAPVLGAGHGASAAGSLRSISQPWAYELSYLALLFHTGLVGFLTYSAGVVWIYWMGIRMIRSGERAGLFMIPILVGLSCFLIGNATNPYLEKYDLMWVVFLPVAFINHWLLHRRPRPG